MHNEAKDFTLWVRSILPHFFKNTHVLDAGGGDINGNNSHLFENPALYVVNDIGDAPNITIKCKTSDLPYANSTFDCICSTECFEHDPEYEKSLSKIMQMLRPGGLFFFTCASTGRAEHGTLRTSPRNSYSSKIPDAFWNTYYKNLTIDDVKQVIHLEENFSVAQSYYNQRTKDLYFIGIKKTNTEVPILHLPDYSALGVKQTYVTVTSAP